MGAAPLHPAVAANAGWQTESETGEIFLPFLALATESTKIFDLFCLECAKGQRPLADGGGSRLMMRERALPEWAETRHPPPWLRAPLGA